MDVRPSGIREIFDMATEGAINLGLGELDFDPPEEARDALKKACVSGTSKYGPTAGLTELRDLIASNKTIHTDAITARNVLVTGGATEGIMAVYQVLLDPGDEILVPEPGFVLYPPDATLVGARPVSYGLREESGFMPNISQIEELITPRTKAIVVNSPSNPTGGVISKEVRSGLLDLAEDNRIWIVSDEVYEDFVYDAEHFTFAGNLENSIVVNSFSKSLAVPGWRIGYLLANEELLRELSKMQYYLLACPATPIQQAITAALPYQGKFIRRILPLLDARRKKMVALLNKVPGFSCGLPSGAFYAFPRYDLEMPSRDLAEAMVHAGVISSPGSAFGQLGEGHLRFSYAASEEDISKGMEIVGSVVESLE
ncbi:MAG: pyridoxal phosphate-dependent aminotransferase [Methanomassiliicoccales archaeon]|nr:pyridoxal phosphate-dependent aminotransferase [Methanomassiliicoccales archaeon]